jgi:FkbM family methyltransferase
MTWSALVATRLLGPSRWSGEDPYDRPPGRETVLDRTMGVVLFTWQHPANRGHRLQSVVRVAKFQLLGRLARRRAVATVGTHSRLWADAGTYISARALYANPLDWNEMLVWQRELRQGSLFVDVGANVGLYTIWALDMGAEVLAIEPNRVSVKQLEENLSLNGYHAEIATVAVGEAPGTLTMTTGLDQQNHLVLSDGDRTEAELATETVEVVTLDDLVGERVVDGLKIDVEGAELLVLKGATRLLAERRIKLLQMEWNYLSEEMLGQDRTAVAALLDQAGYDLFRPDDHGELVPLDGAGYGPDVFARPR